MIDLLFESLILTSKYKILILPEPSVGGRNFSLTSSGAKYNLEEEKRTSYFIVLRHLTQLCIFIIFSHGMAGHHPTPYHMTLIKIGDARNCPFVSQKSS